jgi:hypothetical protein
LANVVGRVIQLYGKRSRPVEQPGHVNAVWPCVGVARDVVDPTSKHGRSSDIVAAKCMGQADGKLRQPLPQVTFVGWG